MYVFHMSRTINSYYFRIQHNRLIFEMEAQYAYCEIETEFGKYCSDERQASKGNNELH
jgi:hypothetical protein